MSKYDWSGVHKDILWISTDWEGWKLEHSQKPIMNEDTMMFESEEPDGYVGYVFCTQPSENEFKGNWKDSLEGRPK